MRSIEILVIGAGASGMMASIEAGRQGAKVLVLEKKPRPGKKLLATGNGKCNFTNLKQDADCYRSQEKELAWEIIRKFDCHESIRWFRQIGILERDRDGYVYPASGQAASVVHALEREMNRLKIELHTEEWMEEIAVHTGRNGADGYVVHSNQSTYLARKVILCTGGMASPVHGSTGDGYALAKKMGHTVIQTVPALTSLLLCEDVKAWAGARLQGSVTLYDWKEKMLCQDVGEIQLVSGGISGIPIFQLSRFAAKELEAGRKVTVVLDSMPDAKVEWLQTELQRRKTYDGQQSMGDLLEGIFPNQFNRVLLHQTGISVKTPAKDVDDTMLCRLAFMIKGMRLEVKETAGFDKAQVTAGGVPVAEIVPETMESKIAPGLYLTGELLDVDGICGGYNLQWAWTTGYLAGRAAAQEVGKVRNRIERKGH